MSVKDSGRGLPSCLLRAEIKIQPSSKNTENGARQKDGEHLRETFDLTMKCHKEKKTQFFLAVFTIFFLLQFFLLSLLLLFKQLSRRKSKDCAKLYATVCYTCSKRAGTINVGLVARQVRAGQGRVWTRPACHRLFGRLQRLLDCQFARLAESSSRWPIGAAAVRHVSKSSGCDFN